MAISNNQGLFTKLEKVIAKEKPEVKRMAGGRSILKPEEYKDFMLMQVRRDGTLAFKHCDSRNYVYVTPEGKLIIPETNEPFQLGDF